VVLLLLTEKPLNVCVFPGTFVTAICVADAKLLVVVVHSLNMLMSADTHVPVAVKPTPVMLFPTPFPVTMKAWIGTCVDPAQTLAAGKGFPDTVVIAFASKLHPRKKRANGKRGFNHRVFPRLASNCTFRMLFITILQSDMPLQITLLPPAEGGLRLLRFEAASCFPSS
jgi:hypothetical protein